MIYLIGFVYSKTGVQDVTHSDIYFAHFFGIFIEDTTFKEFITPDLAFSKFWNLLYLLYYLLN